MDEVGQRVWEFEHPSGVKIKVIDTAIGIELFEEDVLEIIFPELNKEVREKIKVNGSKRLLNFQGEMIEVRTMNSLAVHSLSGMAKLQEVRRFMRWVRKNIMPHFQEKLEKNLASYYTKFKFYNIDYSERESIISYLENERKTWKEEEIDWYVKLINKKILLSTQCPVPSDSLSMVLRQEYFEIASKIIEPAYNYQDLYEKQVLLATNLLKAQELDLMVLNLLRKLKYEEPSDIIRQGLVLQAVCSVARNSTRHEKIEAIVPFYLKLIEGFSDEILAD